MTARTPLKLVNDGTSANPNWNIQAVSSSELTALINQTAYLYGTNPSVNLSVSSTNTSSAIGTFTDTRLQAGSAASSPTDFPSEGATAEPSVVSTTYQNILQSTDTVSDLSDTANKAFPCYINSSDNIQAMTKTDFYDTFIKPAIDVLVSSGDQPGTYRIHTSTSLTDHTNVSTTKVYSDTRANTSLYSAAGIPETLDQPQTILDYFLMRTDAVTEFSYPKLLQINSDNDIQEYTDNALETLLLNGVRYGAVNLTNYKIRYNVSSGTLKGTALTDTRLNGSGAYTQFFANADDYRAQEFPDGTPQTINTYGLYINKTT